MIIIPDDNFLLYRAISQGTSTEMAENVDKYLKLGYRKFQLKVGGNVCDDIARIRAVRELLDRKTLELRESSKAKIRRKLSSGMIIIIIIIISLCYQNC